MVGYDIVSVVIYNGKKCDMHGLHAGIPIDFYY